MDDIHRVIRRLRKARSRTVNRFRIKIVGDELLFMGPQVYIYDDANKLTIAYCGRSDSPMACENARIIVAALEQFDPTLTTEESPQNEII